MPSIILADMLGQLRRTVATIDTDRGFSSARDDAAWPLGVPAIDAALQGGLALGALHEFTPSTSLQFGAAHGFVLAIAALIARDQQVLWIHTDFAALETGAPYGPGLDLIGLPLHRLLMLRVPRPLDVLWAMEEALKSPALAAIIAEMPDDHADLTATRRLVLAARTGGGLGLLLRHRPSPFATAAMTRWEIAAAPSTSDRFGGLGRTTFDLTLSKNRRGHDGRWIMCWNHHERSFTSETLSLGVAETACDRPVVARPLARIG